MATVDASLLQARRRVNRAGFAGSSNSWEGGAIQSKTTNKYAPELRKRAVRMMLNRGKRCSGSALQVTATPNPTRRSKPLPCFSEK